MKKLMLLTAIGFLTAVAGGCRNCDWFRRGAAVPAMAMPAPVCCDPCATAAPACDACAPSGPVIAAPGPATYLPAPAR